MLLSYEDIWYTSSTPTIATCHYYLLIEQSYILLLSVEVQTMINCTTSAEEQEMQRAILLKRHQEELKQTDMKLVMQLDQKVSY